LQFKSLSLVVFGLDETDPGFFLCLKVLPQMNTDREIANIANLVKPYTRSTRNRRSGQRREGLKAILAILAISRFWQFPDR
jgi:hypothetical protein